MYVSQNVKLFSWFNFLYSFRLYWVIAIIYFSQVTGSYALGVSVFSIAQLSQAVFEVPTGVYSDRIGRINTLRLGALASVLSVVSYAIGQSYLVLVIGAVLEGLCRAFFSGNNDALLYETLTDSGQTDKYHEVLGKISSTAELAGFLGVTIGGLVASQSFSVLLWLSTIPQALALMVSFRFTEPSMSRDKVGNIYLHIKDALSYYKHNFRLRYLSLASVINFSIGEATWSLQAAFYNTLLPVWAIGFFLSFNYLASVISYRLSGKIIDRLKALNLLIYQEVYSRVLDIIALARPTILSPALMAAASMFYGAGEVAKSTLLQKEFTDKQRATMASTNSLVGSIFFAIFAVLLGVLADRISLAKSLLFAQICLLPVILIYLKVFRAHNNADATQAGHAVS